MIGRARAWVCRYAGGNPGRGEAYVAPGRGDAALGLGVGEHEKGIWWMPWHREAMKDVARCEKPRGGASAR